MTKPKAQLELSEEDGIIAIQFLQGIAGIKETEEKARKAWQKMTPRHQAFTISFYNQKSVNQIESAHAQAAKRN